MQLFSPVNFIFPNVLHDYTCHISGTSKVTLDGFDFISEYNLIYNEEAITQDKDVNGNTIMRLDPIPEPIPQEWLNLIVRFQTMMSLCANAGEIINRELEELLSMVSQPIHNGPEISPYVLEGKNELHRMDFMGLKNEFSNFLKKGLLVKENSRFDSTSKRKIITVPFNAFVLDRNLYTHGKLFLMIPQKQLLIESKDTNTQKTKYSIITIEHLQSFTHFAADLLDLFKFIKELYKKDSNWSESLDA